MPRPLLPLLAAACLVLTTTVQAAELTPPDGADEAQFAAWLADQRSRVQSGQDAARKAYGEQEYVCWQRFAVNGCLHKARVERRAQLDALRTQELELNQIERDRRTRERLRTIEENRQSRP